MTLKTIAKLWATALVLVGAWFLEGGTAEAIGLTTVPTGWQWLGVAICAVLGGFIAISTLRAAANPATLASAQGQVDRALLGLAPCALPCA